jgi:hypothetical protein
MRQKTTSTDEAANVESAGTADVDTPADCGGRTLANATAPIGEILHCARAWRYATPQARTFLTGSRRRRLQATASVDRKRTGAVNGEEQEAPGHSQILLKIYELHHVGPVHMRDQRGRN